MRLIKLFFLKVQKIQMFYLGSRGLAWKTGDKGVVCRLFILVR